jgi:hypothetical protein
MSSVTERDIADPLSPVTRTERQWLLLSNVVLFAIVYGGLVPSKISAMGIEITKTNRRVLIGILEVVAIYFLTGFVLYAKADWQAWQRNREALENEEAAAANAETEVLGVEPGRHATWKERVPPHPSRSRGIYAARGHFDFWVPTLTGVVNPIICLIGAMM